MKPGQVWTDMVTCPFCEIPQTVVMRMMGIGTEARVGGQLKIQVNVTTDVADHNCSFFTIGEE